jgi:tetratricopeptide (TPR) repeat protein
MLRTIANAYNSQGRSAVAEQYLRCALAIQTELYGEAHHETIITKDELGESLFQLGKHDEGIVLYEQIVSILRERQSRGPDHGDRYLFAAALHGLGSSFVMKGEMDKAIEFLREASAAVGSLDLAQNELGLAAEIKLNLGAAILSKGDLVQSEALLRESLAVFRSLRGDPRWEMGVVLSKLGECLVRQKKFDEANAVLKEGELIYANTIGEANNYLARNLNYQALGALEQNDPANAEKLGRRALDISARSDPPVDSVKARTLLTLGIAHCRMKQRREGRKFLAQSEEIYLRTNAAEAQEAMIEIRTCQK